LRAVSATVELVEQAGKKMIFVINVAAPRARITGEAAVAISQYGTVAPVTLYQRTDFASSMRIVAGLYNRLTLVAALLRK
jgi:chromosome partitioning protein